MGGDSPKLDSLGDPDRMLDAYNNLQTGWQSAGALRRMFNVFAAGAEPAEAIVAKAKLNPQAGPN
jgi:hypothetical protein